MTFDEYTMHVSNLLEDHAPLPRELIGLMLNAAVSAHEAEDGPKCCQVPSCQMLALIDEVLATRRDHGLSRDIDTSYTTHIKPFVQ